MLKRSKIWKRTVYYFAIMLVLYLGAAALFYWEVSFPRTTKNLLVSQQKDRSAVIIAELEKLRLTMKIAGVPDETIKSVVGARVREYENRRNLADRLRVLERTVKNKENQDRIRLELSDGYAKLRSYAASGTILEEARKMNQKSLLVVSVFLVGVGGVMFLLISLILSPLEILIRAAGKVAEGDLNVRFRLRTSDELAHLADVLNDLTANFRELLTLLKRSVEDGAPHIEKLKGIPDALPEHLEAVKGLEDMHQKMDEITGYFTGAGS